MISTFMSNMTFTPELIFDDFDNKSWLDKKHFYNVKELEAYDGLELFVI